MDFFNQELIDRAKKLEPLYNEINSLHKIVNQDKERLLKLQSKSKESQNEDDFLFEQIVHLCQKQIDENTKLMMLKKDFQVILKDFEFESEEEFLKIIARKS